MRVLAGLALISFACSSSVDAAPKDPPGLKEVRSLYERVTKAEKAGELAENKVVVNAAKMPWAVVGTYGATIRIFHGFSEDAPYGNKHPSLVRYEAQSAAYKVRVEYLFDDAGRLRFAFVNEIGPPLRLYWDAAGKVFRAQLDKDLIPPSGQVPKLAAQLQTHAKTLLSTPAGQLISAGNVIFEPEDFAGLTH